MIRRGGLDERFEQSDGRIVLGVHFRMPLHANDKPFAGLLQRFDDAVLWGMGDNHEVASRSLHRLMVARRAFESLCTQESLQTAARRDFHIVSLHKHSRAAA